MKKLQAKNKHLQEDDEDQEDQESMDHDDEDIHSQESEQEVELHDDQKGKQVVQIDVHHQNGDRVCEQCGKRFQNGKALGGHIKVHFNQSLLPKKNKNLFKPKNKHLSLKEAHSPVGDDHSNKISCYVCNKNFPSIKSLHGHMRLHRERDWKGVRPPGPALSPCDESNSSSSYENVSEDEDDGDSSLSDRTIETDNDVANFLVNWTKIEQRRRSLIANQTEPNHAENSGLSNQRQRMPHYAEDQVGEFAGKKPIEESPVGYKGSPSSKKIKCDGRSNKKSTMEASKSTGGTKPMKDIGLLDQTHKQIPTKRQEFGSRRSDTISDVNMDEDSGFSSKYVENQVGELSVKKPIQKSPVGYKGKPSFKIKLKLDGKGKASMQDVDENDDQTSWKTKPKKMTMKSTSKTGTKPIKDTALLYQTRKQMARKTQEFGTKFAEKGKYHEEAEAVEHGIKQFECNICPCKFSTGQALGGHKRGHNYKGVPVKEARGTAKVAPMDLEDGEIRTDPTKFNLDLNQLPHQTDDEDIGG
ncbi:hypothetical protein PRUPE_6G093500 [Prunus persica]|uniref:C2H2-type domain-containing protein n=1 Tax=Prunus persica TaxID=3760 RepID=A0A251NMM5_PRUPE|nr:uncharacterized protein LOC18773858 [Prunus persica]ONI00532.1 hypothetical protein PRUPE_6G093500 [Prunus persica]